MKRDGRFLACLGAVLLLLSVALHADEQTAILQSVIIETFDDPAKSDWTVQGSKFSSVLEVDGQKDVFPKHAFVNAYPEALFRRPPANADQLRVLGVHGKFDRKGFNFVEIFPVSRDNQGRPVPRTIPIPGRVQNMDIWVWGSSHDYYLEIHVKDFRGIVHTLDLGDINHVGWRNLRVNVPSYIPQAVPYIPARKGLDLVKLVLWTRPHEKVDNFFVYLDQLKIFTDLFEAPFDGEDLADPERVQELWANAPGNR